jgi:predicted Fe-Mo cluster-binding NifX family protein
MRVNFKTIYLVIFLNTFFMQVQQSLSFIGNSDVDNSKSSNRIAIATVGDSVNSKISDKAGRAAYYLIFDRNGVFLKSIKNPAQNQRGGASLSVTNLLKKESVKTVISGKFGDKMKKMLETNKIEYHERAGIAKEILEIIIKNKRSKNVQK